MIAITLATLAAGCIVLWRLLHVIATLDWKTFSGPRWCFVGQATTWAMLGAGTLAQLMHIQSGGILLLIGLALSILCDRRQA